MPLVDFFESFDTIPTKGVLLSEIFARGFSIEISQFFNTAIEIVPLPGGDCKLDSVMGNKTKSPFAQQY